MKKQFIIQASVNEDLKAQFEETFENSGANSKGEFLNWLIDRYINPETIIKKVEVIKEVPVDREVEVIKEVPVDREVIKEVTKEVPMGLTENQLLIDLNPLQIAFLKEICNNSTTHKEQNRFAVSTKSQDFYGAILIPFEEGNELHNIKAAMVNSVLLQGTRGPGDFTGTLSNKQIRSIIDTANGVIPEEVIEEE